MEFSSALAHLVGKKGRGAQEASARQVGVTPQYISRLAGVDRSGAENAPRKIAPALGHSYDGILALDRAILQGKELSAADDTSTRGIGEVVEPGAGSCCVAGADDLPAEAKSLVSMAVEVLASHTKYARLLAEQIRSLHESIQFTKEIERLKDDLAEIREITINVVERLAALEIGERERHFPNLARKRIRKRRGDLSHLREVRNLPNLIRPFTVDRV